MKSILKNITALHGANQFSIRKGRSTMLWSFAMIGNAMLTVVFIIFISQRYKSDNIVTRINANCKVNQVPFPAVSICNFNLVSLRETETISRILKLNNRTEREIQAFYQDLPILKEYAKKSLRVGNHTTILSILKEHYFTVDTIMEEVHQKCENLMVYCLFNRKVKSCSNIFKLAKTYEGHCCIFNYVALNDGSIDPFLTRDDDIEYYEDPSADQVKAAGKIIITSESGRHSGLSVIFNLEPKDYPKWSPTPYYAKILISDPNDFPETTILYRYITIGESLDMKVEPRIYQSENDVRQIAPDIRACWFHDETLLDHTDRYSFETCTTECKMRNFLEYCGCMPYKYPREGEARICEFKDLECLRNFRVHISKALMACDPVCYMECRDKKYKISSDITPFLVDSYPSDNAQNHNVSELSSLHVYYTKSTCNCYKLMLLMDFNHFIATYGGVFSLSFGASIITLFEIIYLLLSWLFRMCSRVARNPRVANTMK